SVVPSRSLILVVAGVTNRQPGSDLSETAYFRLTHAGATIAKGDVSPFSESFETRVESAGVDNPALFIRNDHAFDLTIDYRAFVTRPPSTLEHFAPYLAALVPLLAVAILWAAPHHPNGRRSGQPIWIEASQEGNVKPRPPHRRRDGPQNRSPRGARPWT